MKLSEYITLYGFDPEIEEMEVKKLLGFRIPTDKDNKIYTNGKELIFLHRKLTSENSIDPNYERILVDFKNIIGVIERTFKRNILAIDHSNKVIYLEAIYDILPVLYNDYLHHTLKDVNQMLKDNGIYKDFGVQYKNKKIYFHSIRFSNLNHCEILYREKREDCLLHRTHDNEIAAELIDMIVLPLMFIFVHMEITANILKPQFCTKQFAPESWRWVATNYISQTCDDFRKCLPDTKASYLDNIRLYMLCEMLCTQFEGKLLDKFVDMNVNNPYGFTFDIPTFIRHLKRYKPDYSEYFINAFLSKRKMDRFAITQPSVMPISVISLNKDYEKSEDCLPMTHPSISAECVNMLERIINFLWQCDCFKDHPSKNASRKFKYVPYCEPYFQKLNSDKGLDFTQNNYNPTSFRRSSR